MRYLSYTYIHTYILTCIHTYIHSPGIKGTQGKVTKNNEIWNIN